MYLGIDCGTQGTKTILFDPERGEVVARAQAPHAIVSEGNGRREQQCAWWIAALRQALHELFAPGSGQHARDVRAIGVSGQQHGLVLLDAHGQPLRAVKLWNDTETTEDNERIIADAGGIDGVWRLIGTTLPVGYTASKVSWVRRHEPDVYARTRHVLLPHDYIDFWLTGEAATDAGEASGTGYYDVVNRRWSSEMLAVVDASGVLAAALPRVCAPLEPIGTVRREVADEFGFAPGTLVSCGSGDNVMGAVGTGTVAPGTATIGLGTSGVLNVYADRMAQGVYRDAQIFCGLERDWLATVATMNATSSTTLVRNLLGADVAGMERLLASAPPGAEGVRVYPFFSGERVPALPRARGVIKGLSQDNFTPANLMRATAESIALGLKWGFEHLAPHFGRPRRFGLTGGGANSAAWRQILADVLDTEVVRVRADEGGALGAALLALAVDHSHRGVATSLREVCERFITMDEALAARPAPTTVARYREQFDVYRRAIEHEHFDA